MRQAERQVSHSFADGGGKSFLTGKSPLSPGSKSRADMPVIWAILQEYYPGVLSERRCAALRHRSSSSHGLLVRVRFVTPNGVSAHGTEVTTRSQAVRGAVSLHEGTAGCRPHAPPQPLAVCPSLHPSLHPSGPVLRGTPCSPRHTSPAPDTSRCRAVPTAI